MFILPSVSYRGPIRKETNLLFNVVHVIQYTRDLRLLKRCCTNIRIPIKSDVGEFYENCFSLFTCPLDWKTVTAVLD
jgi:hypothetical protein